MKKSILAIIIGLSALAAVNSSFAAENSSDNAKIDNLLRQMQQMSASLAQMKSAMTGIDQRLDTLADMEIRLVRLERDLRHMRSLTNPVSGSSSPRPMLVPATW